MLFQCSHNDHGLFSVSLWMIFFFWFSHSHGHITYPRRRSSSASWWRPTSSQTWPTVSEFTPTHSLLRPLPKDYKTGSGETDWLWEKEPLESGWPAHCLGFHIKGDDLKKKGFCGEMHTCAFWTKDSCWLKQGWGGGDMGRTRSAWFLSYRETVAGKLCWPHASTFTTSTPPSITWMNNEQRWHVDIQISWWRDRSERTEDCNRARAGMGWVLAVPNVPRTGERASSPFAAWMYSLYSV